MTDPDGAMCSQCGVLIPDDAPAGSASSLSTPCCRVGSPLLGFSSVTATGEAAYPGQRSRPDGAAFKGVSMLTGTRGTPSTAAIPAGDYEKRKKTHRL